MSLLARLPSLTPTLSSTSRPASAVTVATRRHRGIGATREALAVLDYERKAAIAVLDAEIVARTDASIRAGELDSHTFTVGDYRIEVDTPTKRTIDSPTCAPTCSTRQRR